LQVIFPKGALPGRNRLADGPNRVGLAHGEQLHTAGAAAMSLFGTLDPVPDLVQSLLDIGHAVYAACAILK
jgi:hypothetical protein